MLTVDVAADIVASGIKVVILLVSVLVVPSLLVGLLVSANRCQADIGFAVIGRWKRAGRHAPMAITVFFIVWKGRVRKTAA